MEQTCRIGRLVPSAGIVALRNRQSAQLRRARGRDAATVPPECAEMIAPASSRLMVDALGIE